MGTEPVFLTGFAAGHYTRPMPRSARVTIAGQPHHITQRGNRGLDIFVREGDQERYLEFLQLYTERHGLTVLGYCLMTNHVHLIAVPETEGSLGDALRAAHARYAQMLNTREDWVGHLWQGRYFSCPLDEAHYWAALRYIEQNPVRAGLVKRAEAYRWSSAAAHCGLRQDPLVSAALPEGVTPRAWRTRLNQPLGEVDIEQLTSRTRAGLPCGDDDYVAAVSEQVGRSLVLRPPGRPRKQRENGD